MASNNPFLNWLRSLGREEEPEQEAPEQEEQSFAPEPAPASAVPLPDPCLLELPPEHAVRKLRSLRIEQSGWLSEPRFSLAAPKGHSLSEREVTRELTRLRMSVNNSANQRIKTIAPQKKDGTEETPTPPDLDAKVEVFVTADAMSAWVYAYPPVGGGKELTQEMVAEALSAAKVTYGVDEELEKRLPGDRERYFHLFPAAWGTPAENGRDGRVVDLFPRKAERKLKVDEFNRVDYASLSFVQSVAEGDPICRMVPPTPGKEGCTVLGKKLPARDGAAAPAPKGRNTEVSEDGATLYAVKTGNVEFNGRAFQVRPVLEIGGNVDFSTGHINFLGDVHIHGDVCTGFTVRAMGSVTIDGVVEAGTVEAGNDLIIVKGAQGDGRAVLRSSHSIYAKYLESCCVYAREDLHADCLINCDVYCDGAVEVSSGRGAIIGGSVRCAHEVTAGAVGSRGESHTEIILGGLPCQEFDQEVLSRDIAGLEEELEKVERQPESPARFTRMGKLRMQLSVDRSKLEQFRRDLAELKEEEEPGIRRLTCSVAYPGTMLTIGERTHRFRRETYPVVAYLDHEGELQLT